MSPLSPDAAMKEHVSLSPMELLFRSFQLMYGNKVSVMWGEVDPDEVHECWGRALKGFYPAEWDHAVDACLDAYPSYPPTLPEFLVLCRLARLKKIGESVKLMGPKTTMPEHIRRMLREYVAKHRVPS